MPVMIRPSKKTEKIAYNIIGTPPNIEDKKSAKMKKIDRQLNHQNGSRIK